MTPKERAWLEAHPDIVLGVSSEHPPILIVGEDGRVSGLMADYLALLNENLGTQITLLPTPMSRAAQLLERNDIDGLGMIAAVDHWRMRLGFTHRLFSTYLYVYTRTDDHEPFAKVDDLAGHRVGYLQGEAMSASWVTRHGEIDAVPFPDNEALSRALIGGDVDAIVASTAHNYWRNRNSILSYHIDFMLADTKIPIVIGVRKDWPELRTILNKGLSALGGAEQLAIAERWFGKALPPGTSLEPETLNGSERAWLKSHPVLRVAYNSRWAPLEFTDDQGRHRGISSSYLALLEERLGVRFEATPVRTAAEVEALLTADAIELMPTLNRTIERTPYFEFTEPYLSMPVAIFSAADVSYLGGLGNLAGKQVAVVADYAVHEWLRRDYPELELVTVVDVVEGLHKVARGEVFAFVGGLITTSHYIGELGLTQVKVVGETPYRYQLGMAVAKGYPLLASAVRKVLSAIPAEQHEAIQRDWISIHYTHHQDYALVWQVLSMGVILLALILYWNRRMAQEIARRAQSEEQLRKLSRAVEQSDSTVVITDLEARIEFANPAFSKTTGYSLSEVVGRNPRVLKSGYHDEAFYEQMWKTLAQGDVWQGELYNRRKDGSLFWEYATISPVKDEQQRVTHYVAVKEDITERKETEQQLLAAKQAAEAANRAKSAFLANMSHELRTPLNAMLGYAQVLQRDSGLDARQRRGVDTIRRSGDYLLTLINDILDLAKIEAGRFDLVPAPCDLPAMLHSLEELFRIRASDKGIGFVYRPADDLPRLIEIDEKRLRQVVMNLLGNAVKFTEQGEVRLECRRHRDEAKGERLVFDIVDTGVGIPEDNLDDLFRPFQQEGSAEYRSQGTGLGLAISKSLVEQMGGVIRVESQYGSGSRFSIDIPLVPLNRAQEVATSSTEFRETLRGYHRDDGVNAPFCLLLVDDKADNRAVLRSLLEPLGFEINEADSGQGAVDEALRHPPDLILMDLVMPGMNGLDAAREILAAEHLPIIACSASTFAEDRSKSLAAGCVEHIAKPVQAESLTDALARYLPLHWLFLPPQVKPAVSEELPSQKELDNLRELARLGKIVPLRQRLAARADSPDPHWHNLAEAAERFDLKRIKELLNDMQAAD